MMEADAVAKTKVNGNFFNAEQIDATLSAGLVVNGSLFVVGGNVMTKISGVQIQAFMEVDGGVVLKGNRCLSLQANGGVEFTFRNGARVTVEATENVIMAKTGVTSRDAISGQFVWKSMGNQITATEGPCYDMLFQGDVQATKDFDDRTLISSRVAFQWTSRYAGNINLPLTINADLIRGDERRRKWQSRGGLRRHLHSRAR